jgi:hypothetical protein
MTRAPHSEKNGRMPSGETSRGARATLHRAAEEERDADRRERRGEREGMREPPVSEDMTERHRAPRTGPAAPPVERGAEHSRDDGM